MARHWAQIGEVTLVKGIKFLFVVHRLLGRWPFRLLAYPTLAYFMIRHGSARRASRAYLARVSRAIHGDERLDTLPMMLRHGVAFAECILDKLRIWAGELRLADVSMHGYPEIQREVQARRGALIIVSHLGNVEVCRALVEAHDGSTLTVLTHTKHARAFNSMLAELDPRSSMNLMQVTELTAATASDLKARLARGEFIVIAADRVPVSERPRVARVPFLAEPADFPVGPYVLASVLQCPVYLLFCILEDSRYHMYFERFRESVVLPRATRRDALRDIVTEYAARLEHYCRRAPLQWFNFYDFWESPGTERVEA